MSEFQPMPDHLAPAQVPRHRPIGASMGVMSDFEAPEPDVVEQRAPADPADDVIDPVVRVASHRPLEANEADVLEQEEEVPIEDDFR